MSRAVLFLALQFLFQAVFANDLTLNSEQSLQGFVTPGVPTCLGPSRSWSDCGDDQSLAATSLTLSYFNFGSKTTRIAATHPHIFYHGRWDKSPMSWWNGSGFKLVVSGLTRLTIHLGPNGSSEVPTGLIIDDGPVLKILLFPGYNTIVFGDTGNATRSRRVIQIDAQEHWRNRLHLEGIELNQGAKLHPYTPQPLRFQFIGDSLTTGLGLQKGIHQSWGYLVSQRFKAETTIQAQPGICLTDQYCYANLRGMEYQYFQTEDPGILGDHKTPTPWDFSRELPPTHVFVHLGANDAGNDLYPVTSLDFAIRYMDFLERLRLLYPTQPFFVVGGWQWFDAPDRTRQHYENLHYRMVEQKRKHGSNIHYVNITGWLGWDDIFMHDKHPTELGHAKMANMFSEWMIQWGVEASTDWVSLDPPPEEDRPHWRLAHGILMILFCILAL